MPIAPSPPHLKILSTWLSAPTKTLKYLKKLGVYFSKSYPVYLHPTTFGHLALAIVRHSSTLTSTPFIIGI